MMKKTLVALAVLGASGLVAAQSSVTLYGVADAGIGRVKYGNPNAKTQFLGGNWLVNNTPSRIGFKGVEDIGGGNVVGFTFETGLSLNGGENVEFRGGDQLFAPLGNTFWDRDANVFIAGGWGALKMGRQVTPTHIAEYAYDLTGLANYSVMRGTYRANAFTAWADSAIAYVTPNMGGLTAAVAFVSKNNIPGATKNVWDLGAWYNNGSLGVGASVNKGLDAAGKTSYQLGAKYGFSNFTVAASYHNAVEDGTDAVRRGFGLGAQAKFGAFTVTLDLTRDTRNEWLGQKYTNGLLEAKYALSKRTFFYADFLRLDGDNNWGLGINHSF